MFKYFPDKWNDTKVSVFTEGEHTTISCHTGGFSLCHIMTNEVALALAKHLTETLQEKAHDHTDVV